MKILLYTIIFVLVCCGERNTTSNETKEQEKPKSTKTQHEEGRSYEERMKGFAEALDKHYEKHPEEYEKVVAEIKRSESVVKVIGKYKMWACGEPLPQILPTSISDKRVDISEIEYGLVFRVPEGMKNPDDDDPRNVAENTFEIEGYHYYIEIDGRRILKSKFDVTRWRILAPYKKWETRNENSEEEGPTTIEMQENYEKYWNIKEDIKGNNYQEKKYLKGC